MFKIMNQCVFQFTNNGFYYQNITNNVCIFIITNLCSYIQLNTVKARYGIPIDTYKHQIYFAVSMTNLKGKLKY